MPSLCMRYGQTFAYLEMKAMIARLLIIFSFSLAQDPSAVIIYEVSFTLPTKRGLWLWSKGNLTFEKGNISSLLVHINILFFFFPNSLMDTVMLLQGLFIYFYIGNIY